MNIQEGYIKFENYQTYYRIVNPQYKKTPLVLLHGGPGSTHNSFELLDDFSEKDERPLIMYDQLGCGKSSHPSDKSLWVKETWIKEFINLREQLHLNEIHLMGHSWGGMLEIIYLTSYPHSTIKSVTLSSTLASVKLWREETHRLIKYLSLKDQKAIKLAEEKNDFSSPTVKKANEHFYKRFIRRANLNSLNTPECLRRKKLDSSESYETAWGVNEYSPSGTLKDYEYLDKLKNIKEPVLLISGTDDESTPLQNKMMLDNLQCQKEWVLLKDANHMTYYDQHDLYEECLQKFLNKND